MSSVAFIVISIEIKRQDSIRFTRSLPFHHTIIGHICNEHLKTATINPDSTYRRAEIEGLQCQHRNTRQLSYLSRPTNSSCNELPIIVTTTVVTQWRFLFSHTEKPTQSCP